MRTFYFQENRDLRFPVLAVGEAREFAKGVCLDKQCAQILCASRTVALR